MLRSAFVVAVVASIGCNDAVIVAVASDRPVPSAIDAICVGVADLSPSGGRFGRRYALEGKLGSLPQTLRVEPGGASEAWAWVRGDRGGVPVARAGAQVDFAGDVTLAIDRCAPGSDGAPALVGDAAGPPDARLVVSSGAGGDVVVALGATAAILDARDGVLVANPAPDLPAGTIVDAIAADVDGDCDDDLVIVATGGPPVVWIRDGLTFSVGGTLGTAVVSAVAAADVDHDGDIDLVTGDGGTLTLWRNDGSGTFADDPAALAGDGRVQSIRALALGDFDGDGNPDLVVGQAGDPLMTWVGEPGGTGSFVPSDAISPIPADVVRMQLADLDGDFDPDLVIAVAGAPLKIFLSRAGLLEDQTFNTFGVATPTATAIAIGGWDLGCEPDLVIAGTAGTETRRGRPGGALELDGAGPAATDVVMVDIDDDGVLDAVIATTDGARWLAR